MRVFGLTNRNTHCDTPLSQSCASACAGSPHPTQEPKQIHLAKEWKIELLPKTGWENNQLLDCWCWGRELSGWSVVYKGIAVKWKPFWAAQRTKKNFRALRGQGSCGFKSDSRVCSLRIYERQMAVEQTSENLNNCEVTKYAKKSKGEGGGEARCFAVVDL